MSDPVKFEGSIVHFVSSQIVETQQDKTCIHLLCYFISVPGSDDYFGLCKPA